MTGAISTNGQIGKDSGVPHSAERGEISLNSNLRIASLNQSVPDASVSFSSRKEEKAGMRRPQGSGGNFIGCSMLNVGRSMFSDSWGGQE